MSENTIKMFIELIIAVSIVVVASYIIVWVKLSYAPVVIALGIITGWFAPKMADAVYKYFWKGGRQ